MGGVHRRLRRDPGGSCYDVDDRRPMDLAELADHVRTGGTFEAVAHDTGRDCTRLVLADLLRKEAADQIGAGLAGGLAAAASAGRTMFQGMLGDILTPRSARRDDDRPGGGHPRRRSPRPADHWQSRTDDDAD
ncbi:hypothetical protein [Pseudonocardia sp. WMMC193]|uniref:hypothetical protein n=1 Tax=Pseudonocardia sp. WMMC193 TaxID=2911965 RepID=UPI001F2B0D23|nr:hypothetical protein [Pseudonocardia sp. WMMC193]MCF7550713.1 hypothetical protein [Pseudonocardia sp. WMMC193]